MIEIKNMEEFRTNAHKLIKYLDEGLNFYKIKLIEPDLIKWYNGYVTLDVLCGEEANRLLREILTKRKAVHELEKKQRLAKAKEERLIKEQAKNENGFNV